MAIPRNRGESYYLFPCCDGERQVLLSLSPRKRQRSRVAVSEEMFPLISFHVMDIGETTGPVRAILDFGDVLCKSEEIMTRALPHILFLSTGCCLPCRPLTIL